MARADVVITGGGTGGHIYPGLAVAESLLQRHPAVRVVWIGTARGLEAELVPRAGYTFFAVPSRGLRRGTVWRNAGALWTAGRGITSAWGLLRRLRPRVVLGTGGYAAGPVVTAAALRRIPIVLQEQNAFPGLTNRILGRFAWRLALGSPAAEKYFHNSGRIVVTGNPVREGIAALPRGEGMRRLGLDPAGRLVFFMGASQGARSVNNAFVKDSHRLRDRKDTVFLLSTGRTGFDDVCRDLSRRWGQADMKRVQAADTPLARWGNVWVTRYVNDMASVYAAADLIVSRAGAMSLAELTVRGVPAVLVPYPYAAEGHQEANARELEAAGAAVIVADGECTDRLIPTVLSLAADAPRLERMRAKSAAAGQPQAARRIASLLETWLATGGDR